MLMWGGCLLGGLVGIWTCGDEIEQARMSLPMNVRETFLYGIYGSLIGVVLALGFECAKIVTMHILFPNELYKKDDKEQLRKQAI